MAGPSLQRRQPDDADTPQTASRGRTALPRDASGEYELGGDGQVIELDLEPDRLSGYITRLGQRDSDRGLPLTYLFASSRLGRDQFEFATRQVHGIWFSFAGTVRRGPGRTRSEAGYYVLEGNLTMHDQASGTVQTRSVSLPLAREYSGG